VPLLPTLSAERIAQELLRLLAVDDPVPALRMMREDGVLAAILPEATRLDRLERLIAVENSLAAVDTPTLPSPASGGGLGWGHRRSAAAVAADPVRRLAALVEIDAAGTVRLAERLRLSNAMRDRLAGLAPPWPLDPAADGMELRRALYRLGADRVRDLALLLAAEGRVDRTRATGMLASAASWKPPRFPIGGRDLTERGMPPGPDIGRLLGAVRDWWEAGDFQADRAACLARLRELIEEEHGPAGRDGAIDGGGTAS
jgi:poly(A) polymerase